MKKYFYQSCFLQFPHTLSAQFVNVTIAPNWAMKDISGKTWSLYQLLFGVYENAGMSTSLLVIASS